MLKARAKQDPRITIDDILGAVAVVYVKVQNRHTRQPMMLQGMAGCDGDAAKETKTHGTIALGVMSRWAHQTEGIAMLTGEHQISCQHTRPGGTKACIQCVRVHRRVWIEGHTACARRLAVYQIDVTLRMSTQQLLSGRFGRLIQLEKIMHIALHQLIENGVDALRAFRVPRRDLVTNHIAVGD